MPTMQHPGASPMSDTSARDTRRGDWVCREDNRAIGQVRDAYGDKDGEYLDIVLYSPSGDRIGRDSPPMGGPTSFEPACPAAHWLRIDPPRFPLPTDLYGDIIRNGSQVGANR